MNWSQRKFFRHLYKISARINKLTLGENKTRFIASQPQRLPTKLPPDTRRCVVQRRKLSTADHSSIKREGKPWRVLFFGTDLFSVQVLRILEENRLCNDVTVMDKLDVVSNIGQTPVRQYAVSAGLTVHNWPLPDLTGHYDVGVLASFGHLIPSKVINMFPYGIMNVHPSLLPRWRGAAPIIHIILSGDRVSGVSIMKLRPKHFDTGPLLSQQEVSVPDNCTSFQLRDLLAEQGGQLILDVLHSLPAVEEQEQKSQGVTYAHKVTMAMTYIHWMEQTRDDIHRQYSALGELLPLRSRMKDFNVKLLNIQHVDKECGVDQPGTVVFDWKRQLLCVRCKDGWVGFENISIKKVMSAQAFYNGYLSKMADRKLYFMSVDNGLNTEDYGKRIRERR